jgi:hypothetical protein
MTVNFLRRFFGLKNDDVARDDDGWRAIPREEAAAMDELLGRLRGGDERVAPTDMRMTFSPVENGPSTLAKVAVQIASPVTLDVTAFLRREHDACSVRVDFEPASVARELLDRALAPKVLRAWEQHRRAARTRGHVSSLRARLSTSWWAPKKIQQL